MFVRNGQALGSVHYATAPKAARPTKTGAAPKKRGRPPKVEDELRRLHAAQKELDPRTVTERYADEEAAKARAEIAAKKTAETKKESDDGSDDKDG